jgi:ribosomal protein S18 acetylase RimI-like enzyme
MENLVFARVESSDLEKLEEISVKTFSETFSPTNSKENLEIYIQENMSFKNLEEEFKNENSEFYFAKLKDEILGYIKLNFKAAQIENFGKSATEIHRIYVLKEFQGKKVGDFLLKNTLEIAKKVKSEFIWLGVWEKNENAISFYEKQGFKVFDKHDFMFGNDLQTDLLMKMNLK